MCQHAYSNRFTNVDIIYSIDAINVLSYQILDEEKA